MKRILFLSLMISAASLFAVSSSFSADASAKPSKSGASKSASADQRIGVVDVQQIIERSVAGQEASSAFNRLLDAKKVEIGAKEHEVKAIDDDIKSGKVQRSPDVDEKLAKANKELQRMKDEAGEALKKDESDAGRRLVADIFQTIRKYAEANKYSMIIEKRPYVIYSVESVDVTQKLIDAFDKDKGVVKK